MARVDLHPVQTWFAGAFQMVAGAAVIGVLVTAFKWGESYQQGLTVEQNAVLREAYTDDQLRDSLKDYYQARHMAAIEARVDSLVRLLRTSSVCKPKPLDCP